MSLEFRLYRFIITKLTLILIIGVVFSASAYSANKCSKIFKGSEPKISSFQELPFGAKNFWHEVGVEMAKYLNYDFQRPVNKKIYSEQIKMNHPTVKFYKSLGFEITQDQTFKMSPLEVLFSNLNSQVADLNHELSDSGADFQLMPKIFLDLYNDELGLKQNVILEPLQDFSAEGYAPVAASQILKTLSFYSLVGSGGFPIGGTESASGLSRSLLEIEKTDPSDMNKFNEKPNISDFLHDLGHFSSFLRNSEYTKAYIRVFRSQYYKIQRMDPDQKKIHLRELNAVGSPAWRRNFYFSESAWIVNKNYRSQLEKYPILNSILTGDKELSSDAVLAKIAQIDKTALLEELNKVKNNWWALFNPLGGAVNDMISLDAFEPGIRQNFIVQKILKDLENYLSQAYPLDQSDQHSLVLTIRFLQNSPRMTIAGWEYFARVDNWKSSEIFKILQDIFPKNDLKGLPDWNKLNDFLYMP